MSTSPPSIDPPVVEPAPPPTGRGGSHQAGGTVDVFIESRVTQAQNALWWAECIRRTLLLVVATLAVVGGWILLDHWVFSPGMGVRLLAFVCLMTAFAGYFWYRLWPMFGSEVDFRYAARSLERTHPELRQALTSYVTLRDRSTDGLPSRIVRSIGVSAAGFLKKHDDLPSEATGTMKWWIATAITLGLFLIYCVASPKSSWQATSRLLAPAANIAPAQRVSIREIMPGDCEAIAGRTIDVTARIEGLVADDPRWCEVEFVDRLGRFPLEPSDQGPRNTYASKIELPYSASGKVDYRIVAGDAVAGPFTLNIQDVPVVALESVHYEPPEYTRRKPFTRTTGSISAIDQTRITITAKSNRPVQRAAIEFNPRRIGNAVKATDGAIEMQVGHDGQQLSVTFPLRIARGRSASVRRDSYRLRIWDASDVANPDPIIYPIEIIPDLAPEIAIMLPLLVPQDVPINAQQMIEVRALDADFGLTEIRLQIQRGLQTIQTPILWSNNQGLAGNQVAQFRFRPQPMGLEVGDVIQVTAWATDNRRVENQSSPLVAPFPDSTNPIGNVAKTDPIELRIVETQTLQPAEDPDNQGLSEPDQQPAVDPAAGQEDSGDSGESGDAGSSGDAGNQNQQADQDGQSGSSAEPSGQPSQGGSGGSTGGEDASQQQSGGSGGDPAGQSSGAADGQSGSASDQSDAGASPDDAASNHPPGGSQSSSANGETSSAGRSGDAADPANQNDPQPQQTPSGANGGGDAAETTNPSSGEPGAGSGSGSAGDQAGPDADGADLDSTGTNQSSRPEHDADAFERIRDHLEQKQRQAQQASQAGKQESGQGNNHDRQHQPSSATDAAPEPRDRENPSSGQGAGVDDGRADPPQTSNQRSPSGDSPSSEPPSADSPSTEQLDGSDHPSKGAGASSSEPNKPAADGAGSQDQTEAPGDDPGPPNPSEQATAEGESNSQASPGESTDPAGTQDGSPPENSGSDQTPGNDAAAPDRRGSQDGGDDLSKADRSMSDDSPGGSDQQSTDSQPGRGSSDGAGSENPASKRSGNQESGDGRPNSNSNQSPSGQDGNDASGESQPGSSSNEGSPGDVQGDSSNGTPSQQRGSSPVDPSDPTGRGQTQPGSGNGIGDQNDEQTPADPVDQVNQDYAKKATDLVLDYLEQTRESPDPELLEKLDWTAEDLRRFRERWQQVRRLQDDPSIDPKQKQDAQDALRSLALRPPSKQASRTTRGAADQLGSIRDAGNRRPPPAEHRDAFDAFRRAMSRKR